MQFCVHLCVHRYFVLVPTTCGSDNNNICNSRTRILLLTPFNKTDRRTAGLTPRAWFVASVIGYAMQREMHDLGMRILSFVGCGAKIDKRKKSAVRRSSNKSKAKSKSRRQLTTRKGGGGDDDDDDKAKGGKRESNNNAKARKKRKI